MAKKYFGTKAMATLVGVFQLAGGIGGFAGPLIAGRIFDETHSYRIVFIIGAVIVAALSIPILVLKKRSMDESRTSNTIPIYGAS
jgi:MFS family permease